MNTSGLDGIKDGAAVVLALATISLGLVQPTVNGIKLALPGLPAWAYLLLTIVIGNLIVALLAVASNIPLTPDLAARIFLASLLVGTGSVGIHELHSRADDARAEAKAHRTGQEVKLKIEPTKDSAAADVTLLNAAKRPGE